MAILGGIGSRSKYFQGMLKGSMRIKSRKNGAV